MANLLVGEENCKFRDIVLIFMKPSMETTIKFEWTKFARYLKSPSDKIDSHRTSIRRGSSTCIDVVEKIVVDWSSRNGCEATIANLLNIMDDNLNWKTFTDFLRVQIHEHATKWDDLDKKSKNVILDSSVQFQGEKIKFHKIRNLINETAFLNTVSEFMDKNIIQKALGGSLWKIDNFDLPKQPPYYINRKVTLSRKLNPAIFKADCLDVFVLQGIERDELSILAFPKQTGASSQQLKKVKVRFILLENKNHLTSIIENSKESVHLIQCNGDCFSWMSTTGSFRIIRQHLINDFEENSEKSLIKEYMSDFNSIPLGICSSPGMGKSMLLGHLAKRLKSAFTERIVLFIQMRLLAPHLNRLPKKITIDSVISILSSKCSTHNFGKNIIIELMKTKNILFEVFIDGFDEIQSDVIGNAKIFLKYLVKAPNIRLFITSRQHLRDDLEKTVGVLTMNIVPFHKETQIKFLRKFWITSCDITDHQGLPQFASKLLEVLENFECLNETNTEFTGIPLQCYMLAEVYSDDAKEFLAMQNKNIEFPNTIKSLYELYTKFMDFKFKNVSNEKKEKIRTCHWKLAIDSLFNDNSESVTICKKKIQEIVKDPLDWDGIYEVGIIESEGKASSRFVHRTFAEFLLAEFVAKHVKDTFLSKFICKDLLATKITTDGTILTDKNLDKIIGDLKASRYKDLPTERIILQETSWQYPAISFFLNSQLSQQKTKKPAAKPKSYNVNCSVCNHKTNIGIETFMSKLLNCSINGYTELFKLLINIDPTILELVGLSFTQKYWVQMLLISSVWQDDTEIFEYVRKVVEQKLKKKIVDLNFFKDKINNSEYEHTPLHEAISRGNYNPTEYLVNYYCLNKKRIPGLVDICLFNSYNENAHMIKTKEMILKYLVKTGMADIDTLHRSVPYGTHITLLKTIYGITNLPLAEKNQLNMNNVVRLFTYDNQMDELVDFLLSKSRPDLITSTALLGDTSVIKFGLNQNILRPETFAKIYMAQQFDLSNFIRDAIICKRRVAFVKTMVELSKDVDLSDSLGDSILHMAARHRTFKVIRYLLHNRATVNMQNFSGNTPLHVLFDSTFPYKSIKISHNCVQLLLRHEASINILNNMSETPLSLALKNKENLHIQQQTITLMNTHKQIQQNNQQTQHKKNAVNSVYKYCCCSIL